jgi:hypothetical protein
MLNNRSQNQTITSFHMQPEPAAVHPQYQTRPRISRYSRRPIVPTPPSLTPLYHIHTQPSLLSQLGTEMRN